MKNNEIKTDLVQIANMPHRNKKAKEYSDKVKRINRINSIKTDFITVLAGFVFGIILALLYCIRTDASNQTFTDSQWIDICYVSRMVEAEAGNQEDLGKRLVADTVLNRLNSGQFGSDIKSILEAENQYCTGIKASDSTIRIVMEEFKHKTNTEVLYFRTDHYHEWATDLFKVGEHYFSK